jgi:hypothetical protein
MKIIDLIVSGLTNLGSSLVVPKNEPQIEQKCDRSSEKSLKTITEKFEFS